MATIKIGIVGQGKVGSALARGIQRAREDVRVVGRDRAGARDTAAWCDIIILAVPFSALDDVVQTVGEALGGKPVVDVTNALGENMTLAVGFTTSGAEELQRKLPHASVVKAFNTVFAQHMDTGRIGDQPLSALVASDDAEAKRVVLELALGIGFEPVDAGPLKNARLLEPMGLLNIQLGYALEMGPKIGFRLVQG